MLDQPDEFTTNCHDRKSPRMPALEPAGAHGSEPHLRHRSAACSPDFHHLSEFAASFALDPHVVRWNKCHKAVLGRLEGVEVVSHLPDLEVEFLDGSVAVADADGIVGFEPIDPALRYIDAAVERPLDAAMRRNLRCIVGHVNFAFTSDDRLRVLEHLRLARQSTLVEAAAATEDSNDPVSTIVAMAARRMVDLDWRSGPITAASIVNLRAGLLRHDAPDERWSERIF